MAVSTKLRRRKRTKITGAVALMVVWQPWEDAILREDNAALRSRKQTAQRLPHRTPDAIQMHCKVLGLRLDDKWPERRRLIARAWRDLSLTLKQASQQLGMTEHALRAFASKHELGRRPGAQLGRPRKPQPGSSFWNDKRDVVLRRVIAGGGTFADADRAVHRVHGQAARDRALRLGIVKPAVYPQTVQRWAAE